MNRPLNVSTSILNKVPVGRRHHTLSNVKWISRNVRLTSIERREIVDLIKELASVLETS